MIVPTASNVKFKFPEFASVADSDVEFAIEEASRNVDDSWLEGDRTLALMYLTGHYLAQSLQRAASATGQKIRSERVGDMSITYENPTEPTNVDQNDLYTTMYGRRYMELAHINFPGIAVI